MGEERERRRRRPPERFVEIELTEEDAALLVAVLADFTVDDAGGSVDAAHGSFLTFDQNDLEDLRELWDAFREKLRRGETEWPETDNHIPQWFAERLASR